MICPKCGQHDINNGTICTFCHAPMNQAVGLQPQATPTKPVATASARPVAQAPARPAAPASASAPRVAQRRPQGMPQGQLSPSQLKIARIILSSACLIGAFFAGREAWGNLRAYNAASSPRVISVAEAFAPQPSDAPRWVTIDGGVELDCSQGLEYSKDSSVVSTSYLALDPDHSHGFIMTYKGSADCRTIMGKPFTGLLKPANLLWWTKNGMPSPTYPMMELKVGEDNSDLRSEALWAGVAVVFLGGLGLFLAFARVKTPIRA